MPFFEMSWHLFSGRESNEAINLLRSRKHEYLFVDTNIDEQEDMCEKLCLAIHNESASRRGRYNEMRKIFSAVRDDYEKVEEGVLLSIYKRKE